MPEARNPIDEIIRWWESMDRLTQSIVLFLIGCALIVAGVLIFWFLHDKPVGDIWFIIAVAFIIVGIVAILVAILRLTRPEMVKKEQVV